MRLKQELSKMFYEHTDFIRREECDELALRTVLILRKHGTIITRFTESPKYILMLPMEETKEIQEFEKLLDDPEYNLKIMG